MSKRATQDNGVSTQEAIRIEAYLLSEKAGHPSGMEHSFWKQAEALVHGRMAGKISPSAPGKKPVAAKSRSAAARKPATAKKTKTKTTAKAKGKGQLAEAPSPFKGAPVETAPAAGKKPARRSKPTRSSALPITGRKSKK